MAQDAQGMIEAEVARLVAQALRCIADKLGGATAPAPVAKQAHLIGKAQPRIYQVSVPGLLASTLRSTPSAASLSTAFEEASVVNRGRGTTTTITLRGDSEAAKMLDVLIEASNRTSHRDIPRAIAEIEAALRH